MARRRYLIAYDISDDRRRTAVFKTLLSYGDHLQYSVFVCALGVVELARLRDRLGGLIDGREDQVIVADLGPDGAGAESVVESLGRRYVPAARVRVF